MGIVIKLPNFWYQHFVLKSFTLGVIDVLVELVIHILPLPWQPFSFCTVKSSTYTEKRQFCLEVTCMQI